MRSSERFFPTTMRAVWLEGRRLLVRDDVPVPQTPKGESLLRVLRAGICNTDLELVKGYYPFSGVLGHEFVAEVVRGPELLLGRRVVGEINAVCHECDHCRAGRPTHCSNRSVLGIQNRHGAFAEYTTLPDENLHVVPDDVDTDAATFAEPLAAALQIQTQVRIGPEDRVLVVGDGKLGQLIARTLKRVGCALQVVGKHAAKLRMLQDCGIETVFADGVATGKFDVSIEATGNADGFSIARRGLRPRGTLVLKSTYRGGLTLDVSRLVVDEVTVVGSRCGPFEPALTFLSEHAAELRSLITARYPLMEGIAAFDYARQPAAMKVLFDTELAGV